MSAKKQVFLFCSLVVMVVFFGCSNQKNKDNKQILDNYSNDLSYNFDKPLFFLPMPVYQNFLFTYRAFNPATEYDETVLEIFSPGYIRSNIYATYNVFLNSKKIPCIIQFPNRTIFDARLAKLKESPMVTKDALKKFLKFEYAVDIEGIELVSENFVYIHEDSLINGEPRSWLSEDDYSYFFSDDFDREMNVLISWINGKKWNDLNSTISIENGQLYIYTFDPANGLPVINNIDRVSPVDSEPHTYITQTGYYTHETLDDAAEIDTFGNDDGSLDIFYGTGNSGVRVFLSGAVTEIDQFRRVIPQQE